MLHACLRGGLPWIVSDSRSYISKMRMYQQGYTVPLRALERHHALAKCYTFTRLAQQHAGRSAGAISIRRKERPHGHFFDVPLREVTLKAMLIAA